MRELTKSLGSFGWAMSLFGLKRLAEMMMPRATPGGPPGWVPGTGGAGGAGTEPFDRMTEAAREHLGDGGFHEVFRSGDQIFRGLVDMMLGGSCADCPPQGWGASGPRPSGRPPYGPRPGEPQPPRQPAGWGPMPAESPPPGPRNASPGGWGPMPADAQAAGAEDGSAGEGRLAAAAGARGWGPMPAVPPPGVPPPAGGRS